MSADDFMDARDELCADMASHMRARGREVSALENQSLAAQAMEQIERLRAETKPAPPADPTPEFTGVREGAHGVYLLGQSSTNDIRTRPTTAPERWFYEHAMPRLQTLLSAEESGPLGAASWKQKLLAVLSLQADAAGFRAQGLEETARDRERRYMFELIQLLDESDAVFKPSWKADPERRIQVGAGQ